MQTNYSLEWFRFGNPVPTPEIPTLKQSCDSVETENLFVIDHAIPL